MAKIIHVLLSVLIFLLVLALAVAAGYWGFVIKHWPWWGALTLAVGVFALYFLILFFKKYFIRRHEKKFVQRIVDHGEVLSEDARPEQLAVQELEKTWKKNLDLLKSSHLRKKGNPLYVLPWYMTMGESGVGKSTLLAHAGIASSFTELQNQQGHVGPTRNCDWIFFDSAVILDTAGRYSVPPESNTERNEWKRFLLLLVKARRREPLNGIILCVAADDLVNGKTEDLRLKGQVLRNRIHTLMRTTGFKIPVSVVVTKMDTVPGFTEFAELLDEKSRQQAMGQMNSQATPFWQELLDLAMAGLDLGLQNIRKALVSQPEGRKAAFFAFPRQLAPLKKGLEPLLDALFTENSYQETPVIQGIYWGSGQCSESPLPSFLQPLASGEPTPATRRGFSSVFIHDLFVRVLPATRWNFTPVKEFIVWKRIVHNLAIVSWLCVLTVAAGVIGLSYFHSKKVYSLLPTQSLTLKKEAADRNAVLIYLERMRLAILKVEEENSSWMRPFLLFNQEILAEKKYKKEYCRLFSAFLLDPLDRGFDEAVSRMDKNTPPELYADYCAYAVEQSLYLQNYLAGRHIKKFSSFNQVATAVLNIGNTDVLPEAGSYFPDLNSSYLAWSHDRTEIEERLTSLQKTLQVLLAKNPGEISWLYTVSIADTPPLTLSDFWQHQQVNVQDSVLVPGAFTRKGREKIENFLLAAQRAGAGDTLIKKLRQGYLDSYPLQFVHWWRQFGDHFQDGELELATDADWRESAILMAGGNNPYFQMMETMARELSSFAQDTGNKVPNWGKAVIDVNAIRKLADATNKSKTAKPSLLSKVTAEKDKVTVETLQDVDPAKAKAMTEQLKLAAAWSKYEDGLTGLNTITPYREKAAEQFTTWFQNAAGTSKEQSVFSTAYDAWITLRIMGQKLYTDPFVWKIVDGPFVFLQDFAARQTAAVLQEKWQEDVLSVATNIAPNKVPAVLFSKTTGLMWKFVNQYADAFVMQSVDGYKARTFYGRSLIFQPDFYSMLNLGSALVINAQPEYDVTLATQPMEVSSKATVEPTNSVLSIQCSKKKYILENDNFPRTLTVQWSQKSCGDVLLTIGFPGLELTKKWTGSLAFVHFLDQFAQGSYKFVPKDFPESAGYMKEHQIDYISLSYVLTGENDILQLLNEPPKKIEHQIILPERQITAKVLPKLSESVLSEYVLPEETAPDNNSNNVPPSKQDTETKQPETKATTKTAKPVEKKDSSQPLQDKTSTNWHDGQWLLKQDPSLYTVQIMSLQSTDPVAKVFAQVPDQQHNAVYEKTVAGKHWFILVSGLFNDVAKAKNYLTSLPAAIQKAQPMVKPIWEIQEILGTPVAEKTTAAPPAQKPEGPTAANSK